jgi:drug/metabolite transporter (DMT)-like permease
MVNLVILLSILCSSVAQIFLKKGMNICDCDFSFAANNLLPLISGLVLNPFVVGGVLLHVLALLTWLYVLKHVDVSYAYPFISVGFVIVLGLGYLLFDEQINIYRISGVGAIMLGIFLISKSTSI